MADQIVEFFAHEFFVFINPFFYFQESSILQALRVRSDQHLNQRFGTVHQLLGDLKPL